MTDQLLSAPALAADSRARGALGLRRPALIPFVVAFLVVAAFGDLVYRRTGTPLNWWLSIVWSLPIGMTVLQARGALRTRRCFDDARGYEGRWTDPLIIVVPTVGRRDVMGALHRVVLSFVRECPSYFDDWRLDVVTEETAEALSEVKALAGLSPRIRVLVVPEDYRTAKGTRWKARAAQFALEERTAGGLSTDDVWVLHMDDDTAAGPGTMEAIAHFLANNPGDKHLAQGVLAYPRQCSINHFTWLLDAVRPGFDVSLFAALTGTGTPLVGAHGELLLIRASVEAEIGWDFGPKEIVEDARFALEFATRHPGGSAWFSGLSYGSSPETLRDLVRQRARWSEGLLRVVTNRSIPLRKRGLLAYVMAGWQLGIFQHIVLMLPIAVVVASGNTCPVAKPLIALWAAYFACILWSYWEGLKINSDASGFRPRRRDQLMLVGLAPVLGLCEAAGGTLGVYRAATGRTKGFTVIAKNQ